MFQANPFLLVYKNFHGTEPENQEHGFRNFIKKIALSTLEDWREQENKMKCLYDSDSGIRSLSFYSFKTPDCISSERINADGFISLMAVKPELQRKGLAGLLIHNIRIDMRNHYSDQQDTSVRKLGVTLMLGNESAKKCYQKNGFVKNDNISKELSELTESNHEWMEADQNNL